MRVLHVSPTFYPAVYWGGPIYSTKSICDATQDAGVEVSVLTTDAAGPDRWDRIPPDARGGLPYPVRYARRQAGVSISTELLGALPAALRQADLVHLTGTFSFPTLPVLALAQTIGRPVVWSLRGATQAMVDWKDNPNPRLKSLFLSLARGFSTRSTVLHATAETEASANARLLPGSRSVVIPNAVATPHRPASHESNPQFRLIFMSRVHPKKGLDLLLDAMGQLPNHVTLDIYGTGAEEHVARFKAQAASLGGRVRWHGHLDDADKAAAFARADAFVLPSHSENFGIVVAEALAHGVPAITTHNTPWKTLEIHGCGRWIPLSVPGLVRTISEIQTADLPAMSARARALVRARFGVEAMGERFVDLYSGLLVPGQEVPA